MTTFIERLLAVVADGPQPAADARSADVSGVEDRRGSAEISATGTAEVGATGTALGANAGDGRGPFADRFLDAADDEADQEPTVSSARLALGLASLAAEHLRLSTRGEERLAVAVGLVGGAVERSRSLAVRLRRRSPASVARGGARLATELARVDRMGGRARRLRASVGKIAKEARSRGNVTIAAGRDDALTVIKSTVEDGLAWAQNQAVPRVIDGMMPRLVNDVVPRIVEGSWPQVRARVLPTVVDDLVNEERIRDLIAEHTRIAVARAVKERAGGKSS